jgi:two-component system LytT family response regulator
MPKISTVIVDDEPPARRKLRSFLDKEEDFEVAGEAGNGEDAVRLIEERKPDVVFLDIQMPGANGFEVLEALKDQPLPLVVFVTAYDQYAVKAFDVQALDYLLKPFDRPRLQACLERVRAALAGAGTRDLQRKMDVLLQDVRTREYLQRVLVRTQGRVVFLKMDDVDWIESSGNYAELHAGRQAFIIRETIATLEARLDPKRFARIHRSTIVNVDRIKELQPWSHNDYRVILKDGSELRMSRRYRSALL